MVSYFHCVASLQLQSTKLCALRSFQCRRRLQVQVATFTSPSASDLHWMWRGRLVAITPGCREFAVRLHPSS
uniref:Uncharacterized protein n=1 Tax=Oryza nivara TaxID=4536 RepID=A0A0E0IZ25_ORYNI